MFKRVAPGLLCLVLVVIGSGCIESKNVVTLNPDGKGKIQFDILMPAVGDIGPVAPGGKDESPEGIKQRTVAKLLTDAKGVTAWKDVSAEWAADGRLHFLATAYFDKLDQVKIDPLPLPQFKLEAGKDGVLKLTQDISTTPNTGPATAPPKPTPDPKKLSDKELDEEILKMRIQYQAGRPMFIAMFHDLKATTTFNLPGKASDVKGFKKEGDKVAANELKGADLLKALDAVMAKDDAALRKLVRDAGTLKPFESKEAKVVAEFMPDSMNASLTIKDVGSNVFDYDKEMKQAREGSAGLRDKFKIDSKMQWPWEKPQPPKP
jgi:hypothetical protein